MVAEGVREKVKAGPGPLHRFLIRERVWWALQDLNLQPTDYESAALTIELRAQAVYLLMFNF